MVAVLLSALFVGTGLLAASVIAASWRLYGAAALALRTQLAACEDWREVRVRVSDIRVGRNATVLRPNFTTAGQRRPSRVALPAAA